MTRDTEDVVARRAAIRDILYRLLPQEIDANICRAVADEFLALEASDRQSLSDRIDGLEGQCSRLRRCLLPVQMTLAQAECVDEPIPDDAVVLHFMGSGASDQVTAGEVRAALHQEGISAK